MRFFQFKKCFFIPLITGFFTIGFTTQLFADKSDVKSLKNPYGFISYDEHQTRVMHFVVIKRSKRISDSLLKRTIKAIEIQTKRDFAPYYGISAQFEITEDISKINLHRSVPIIISDLIEYPKLPKGIPFASIKIGSNYFLSERPYRNADVGDPKIFPNDFKGIFTKTVSRKVLEILGNYQDAEYFIADAFKDRIDFFSRDICNPVANSAYKINGLFMQDFVLPSYWVPLLREGPFDFMHTITAPLTPFKGYQTFLTFTKDGGDFVAWVKTIDSCLSDPRTLNVSTWKIFDYYYRYQDENRKMEEKNRKMEEKS